MDINLIINDWIVFYYVKIETDVVGVALLLK